MRVIDFGRVSLAGLISLSMVVTPTLAQQATTVTPSAQPAASAQTGDWEKEFALWQAAAAGNTAADFEAYLSAYPAGKFAAIAKNRVTGLQSPATMVDASATAAIDTQTPPPAVTEVSAPASAVAAFVPQKPAVTEPAEAATAIAVPTNDADWQQEYALWQTASNGNTVTEYESYLAAYPAGKFAAIGQSRIARMSAVEDEVAAVSAPTVADQQVDLSGSPQTEYGILDRDTRREVQGRLSALGFITNGTDGVFGPRSRAALSQWQAAASLPVSGFLNFEQLTRLRQDSNAVYGPWLQARNAAAAQRPVRRYRDRVLIGRVDNSGRDAAIALGVLGIGAAILGAGIGGRHGHRRHGRW